MSLIVDGDEQSARAAVHEAVLLAGEAHGRRVHDGHHLRYVLADEAVEEMLIAVLRLCKKTMLHFILSPLL